MRRILPILLAAVLLAACCGDDDISVDEVDVPPFFLVATVTVEDNGHLQREGEPRRSEFRWRFQDPEHSRSEIEVFAPVIEAGVTTFVSRDGTTVSYSSFGSDAQRLEIPFVGFPSFSLMIGPTFTNSLPHFLERWASFVGEVVMSEPTDFLGREVVIVEVQARGGSVAVAEAVAPSAGDPSGEPPPQPDDPARPAFQEDEVGSVIRIWFEPATGFIWRSEIFGAEASGEVEIVELDFNPDFDRAGLFDLALPEGVMLVEREQGSSSSTRLEPNGQTASFNAPFLNSSEPSPIGGFRSMGEGHESGRVAQAEALFSSGGSEILISQRFRRDGVPAVLREGESISIGDHAGYEVVDGDRRTLAWAVDAGERSDLVIVIEAVNVDREELLGFAASFE